MYRLHYLPANDDTLLDVIESESLPCIRSAMIEAIRIAKELAVDAPSSGKLSGAIQICDMEGRTQLTIALDEAVRHVRRYAAR